MYSGRSFRCARSMLTTPNSAPVGSPAALLLSAGATLDGGSGAASEGTIPEDAVETTRTEPNGDQVTEFRVDGRLRALKVVPSRGPTYYLYDRNGDGVVDEE